MPEEHPAAAAAHLAAAAAAATLLRQQLAPARRVNLRARAGKGSIRVAVCSAARTVVLASGATFMLSLVLVQHETGESSVAGGVVAVTVQLVRLTPLQGPH